MVAGAAWVVVRAVEELAAERAQERVAAVAAMAADAPVAWEVALVEQSIREA